jgi:DNA mismatch endonuclease (patch repair protein)
MDRISAAKRSWNMSRIKNADTKPELAVRFLLHRLGYRFRLHRKDLPGKPDIVLPRLMTVVLVHGCYWHRHPGCRYAYTPKSRTEFWKAKFRRNQQRDIIVRSELSKLGWRVLVVWECETKDMDSLTVRLRNELMGTDL